MRGGIVAPEQPKNAIFRQYQFWRHDKKPLELWPYEEMDEKINHICNQAIEANPNAYAWIMDRKLLNGFQQSRAKLPEIEF